MNFFLYIKYFLTKYQIDAFTGKSNNFMNKKKIILLLGGYHENPMKYQS